MLGFGPLSDLPLSDLPGPIVPPVPSVPTLTVPIAGLREGEGAKGGYLVPPEVLGMVGQVRPGTYRPPELVTYARNPWEEERLAEARKREAEDEEALLALLFGEEL